CARIEAGTTSLDYW
nr:immunoglobulin heavy chain junction region [Macaca mulatta]MOY29291.1 immunoglobulin heavy chain junction region [Macaca mulatta]